ncbi:MAG TPA: TlpA disulfide reductase family protein [Mycobacterium sp.]
MRSKSASTRWMLAAVVVVLALIGALIAGLTVELRHGAQPVVGDRAGAERSRGAPAADLAEARRRAGLSPCPAGPDGGPSALRQVTVECAADGAAVDAARVLAGRRVVLNLWAYWCLPCRAELPAMAEYQRQAGPEVLVVTVHQDENEVAALSLLTQLGVRLPTLQDGKRLIAAGLRVPNVMPATVVLTADGSVARILPQAFASAEEISVAVGGRNS